MLKMNRNMGREHILEWYFAIDGVTNGPFDAEAMKQLFREGKIGPKTSVWSAETGDWVQFNTTALQASAGPPPPPRPRAPADTAGRAASAAAFCGSNGGLPAL